MTKERKFGKCDVCVTQPLLLRCVEGLTTNLKYLQSCVGFANFQSGGLNKKAVVKCIKPHITTQSEGERKLEIPLLAYFICAIRSFCFQVF